MLVSMMSFVRSQGAREVYVPVDCPKLLRQEFGAKSYPLAFHCLGRFGRLNRSTVGQIVSLAVISVLLVSLVVLRRTSRRALPWQFMEAELVNALARVDAVVLSGGGYLTDVGRLECRGCLLTALTARMLGVPILMTGQGVGPFDSRLTLLMLGMVVRKARFIAVRDDSGSGSWLSRAGAPASGVRVLGDDAFALALTAPARVPSSRMLAVHIRRSSLLEAGAAVQVELSRLVRIYRDSGWRVRFLIFSERAVEELALVKTIDPKASLRDDVVATADPRLLCSALGECTLAIGFAYHFGVFALCQGVPARVLFEGEYYGQKMSGLMGLFGRSDWAIPMEKFRAGEVVSSFAIDLCNLDETRTGLQQRALALTNRQRAAYRSAFS